MNDAKRNALVRSADQSCAMTQSTSGGPPIEQSPPVKPLLRKAAQSQPPCSFARGRGRQDACSTTISSMTSPTQNLMCEIG